MSTEELARGFAVISWLSILVLGPGAVAIFVWAMLDLYWSSRAEGAKSQDSRPKEG